VVAAEDAAVMADVAATAAVVGGAEVTVEAAGEAAIVGIAATAAIAGKAR
jgi:hypothetical protein